MISDKEHAEKTRRMLTAQADAANAVAKLWEELQEVDGDIEWIRIGVWNKVMNAAQKYFWAAKSLEEKEEVKS